MNLAVAKAEFSTESSWRIFLEPQADGQMAAWVTDFPDCRVVAESREAAIAGLETLLEERMQSIQVVSRPIQPKQAIEHPIAKFAGIFKDDADFGEIVAQMRAERELDDTNPAYTMD